MEDRVLNQSSVKAADNRSIESKNNEFDSKIDGLIEKREPIPYSILVDLAKEYFQGDEIGFMPVAVNRACLRIERTVHYIKSNDLIGYILNPSFDNSQDNPR